MTTYMILPTEEDGYVVRTRHNDGRLGLIEGFRTFDEAQAWVSNRKAQDAKATARTAPSSTVEWQGVGVP